MNVCCVCFVCLGVCGLERGGPVHECEMYLCLVYAYVFFVYVRYMT